MTSSYVMKVSRNGQVSIPAATRARWHADKVLIVDTGDHIVIRPLPEDPIGELVGKYKGRGPSTDEMRRQARLEDEEHERRRP